MCGKLTMKNKNIYTTRTDPTLYRKMVYIETTSGYLNTSMFVEVRVAPLNTSMFVGVRVAPHNTSMFFGVRVTHHFSVLCRVVWFVVFVLCPVSTVAYVSELFILDCPFGFLSLNCPFLIAPSVFSLWIVHSWLPPRFSLSELSILDCPFCFLSLNCPFLIAPSVFLNVYLHTYATAQCAGLLQVHYHGSILLKVSVWPYNGKHEGLVHFVMLMK